MRKTLCLTLCLVLFLTCGPKQNDVKRVIEDGVEVVLNNIDPYTIKGMPKTFLLEEEIVIDTEKDEIAEIGLTDIRSFGVDSSGNIYISRERAGEENYIFKFDEKGNYLLSFGRQGQGPGEFQNPPPLALNELDEVIATAPSRRRLILFDKNGTFLREIAVDVNIGKGILLKNGNYLIFHQLWGRRDSDYMSQAPLSLWNSEFKVSIPQGYKDEKLKDMNPEERKVTFFPDSFPPYQSFFTSDNGWIFVMTNEKGENKDELIFDIFNSEGVFIGRKTLKRYFRKYDAFTTVRNNKFYCIHEKENGFKKLVVYRMKWE